MILVTLGTQKEQFVRLLNYIENSNINDEIIVQAGYTEFKSEKMKIFDFINYEEMDKYIEQAELIITHGGTGSILGPLKKEKKVIACARLSKYDEHVDNHQEELVSVFADAGYVLSINENDDFDSIYEQSKSFIPKKYSSNTEKFIKKLEKEIAATNFKTKSLFFWRILLLVLVLLFLFLYK